MSQYPPYVTHNGTIYCVATGCKTQPSAAERILSGDREDALPTPRYAIEGSDLCSWHVDRFSAILGDLVSLHQVVERAVLRRPSSSVESVKVQTSGVSTIGDRWNPTAAHVLAQLNDWTGFITRVVLRERPLSPDVVRAFDRTDVYYDDEGERVHAEVTVTHVIETHSHGLTVDDHPRLQLAAIALHHARWLALYPTLGPAVLQDALDHRRVALTVDYAATFRRVALPGKFCHYIEDDTEFGPVYCGGQIWGILRDASGNRPSEILCSNDPAHRIPRDEWMAYAG